MRIFSSLYEKVLQWSAHKHAPRYLAGLSFAESSFFPVPPDVMLAPMTLANPAKAWFFASLTTIASVAGGIAGYLIGLLAFDLIAPLLHSVNYWDKYLAVKDWFDQWGFWIIFIAGFSPIPYKVFTIGAGAVSLTFLPFVIASLIGRGARFFLVAGLIVLGGERMERALREYVDFLGWALIIVLVLIYFLR